MKKLKKNWKKIIIAVALITIVIIAGVFLWIKTWKTVYSSDKKISIMYPSTGYIAPTQGLEIKDDRNHFFLTINNVERIHLLPDEISPNDTESIAKIANNFARITKEQDNLDSTIRQINISGHTIYIVTSPAGMLFDKFQIITSNDGIIYRGTGWYLDPTNKKLNNSKLRTITNDFIINLMVHTIQFH